MCGIAGFIRNKHHSDSDFETLEKMLKAIAHRGPDDQKIYSDSTLMIGFRRLSIIDIQTGQQPIFNEDKSIVIVCNGEIYNYKTLRKELEEKGHIFHCNSDTEVIVHLYEEYGEDFLIHLDGMFALCLWDIHNNKLFLARDPVGKKPLYYMQKEEMFVFASEHKAFNEYPYFTRELDMCAAGNYFILNYIPYPQTIYKNVYKVPPGSVLIFQQGKSQVRKYRHCYAQGIDTSISFETAKKILQEKFFAAVEKRLMSDVPLGVLLSGGLDSSGIVAALHHIGRKDIPTFSVSFKSYPKYDEGDFSQQIADYFKTDHTVFNVEHDCLELLETVIYHMDEPIADKALIPSWLIFQKASKQVKVILSGEGADELFGGYEKYQWLSVIPNLPLGIAHLLEKGFVQNRRIKKCARLISLPAGIEKIIAWDRVFLPDELTALIPEKQSVSSDLSTTYDPINKKYSLCGQTMMWDFLWFLPENLLMKVDKLSMAHGLEARAPYLDRELVQYASSLPRRYKTNIFSSKTILRSLFKELLPETILKRKKHGFTLPINEWLKDSENPVMKKYFSHKKILSSRFFNRNAVEHLLLQHRSNSADCTRQLWNILTFYIWTEQNDII